MKLLSIIIPVFNEEKRLDKTFKALSALSLPRGFGVHEVIFVNDGSTDKTRSHINKFIKQSSLTIRLISYKRNKGKGYAVKVGMLESTGDYALLCDADMSTPFSELKKFMPFVKNNADIMIGTRKNGKSTVIVHQPYIREKLGKGFTYFTQKSLGLSVTDFTCGFKLFSKKAVGEIFPHAIINRWGYDAEILYIGEKKGLPIYEHSVMWSNDERTHVNLFTAVPITVLEIIKIITVHSALPSVKKLQSLVFYIERAGKAVVSLF